MSQPRAPAIEEPQVVKAKSGMAGKVATVDRMVRSVISAGGGRVDKNNKKKAGGNKYTANNRQTLLYGLQSLYDKESAEEAKETNSKFISITEEALARIQGVELHSVPEVGVIVVLKWPVVNMPLSDAQAVTKTLPYTQFDLDDISDMNTLKTTISRHYEPWKITNVEEQHNAKENEPDPSNDSTKVEPPKMPNGAVPGKVDAHKTAADLGDEKPTMTAAAQWLDSLTSFRVFALAPTLRYDERTAKGGLLAQEVEDNYIDCTANWKGMAAYILASLCGTTPWNGGKPILKIVAEMK